MSSYDACASICREEKQLRERILRRALEVLGREAGGASQG